MMAGDNKKILIVEGEADRSFFEAFCKKIELSVTVQVATPKELDARHNGKESVFNLLSTELKNLGVDNERRLAIVVDSDQIADGKGFANTHQRISKILKEYGFEPRPDSESLADGGLLFKHNDGLADFGAWVMPNNKDEGMLENWISQAIHPNQQTLFQHAQKTVANLPPPVLFKEIRTTKADVATWLAWQEKPGEGLYYSIKGNLLNPSAPLYIGLENWLRRVFLKPTEPIIVP